MKTRIVAVWTGCVSAGLGLAGLHAADKPKAEDQFESLHVKKMDDQHFRVELQYSGKDGKLQTREFTGTLQEIENKIATDKSLPAGQRQYVRRALHTPTHFTLSDFDVLSGIDPADADTSPEDPFSLPWPDFLFRF
jgi:hypothetical protein